MVRRNMEKHREVVEFLGPTRAPAGVHTLVTTDNEHVEAAIERTDPRRKSSSIRLSRQGHSVDAAVYLSESNRADGHAARHDNRQQHPRRFSHESKSVGTRQPAVARERHRVAPR